MVPVKSCNFGTLEGISTEQLRKAGLDMTEAMKTATTITPIAATDNPSRRNFLWIQITLSKYLFLYL
jgi:hypothetical protein